MGDRTKIEWADASWTPIRARNLVTDKIGWHCEHASPGCVNCYSEAQNKNGFAGGTRLAFKPGHRADVELFFDEAMLTQPLRWKKPRVVFVCSMTDLFADFVTDAWIDRIFAVMALAPQHTFVVLTKRAKRMREYCTDPKTPERVAEAAVIVANAAAKVGIFKARAQAMNAGVDMVAKPFVRWPLPNVYKGVTAEDQPRADERIPDLLATPAAGRFVSIEPMLGPIDLTTPEGWLWTYGSGRREPIKGWPDHPRQPGGLDGVIVGGESGPGARPMHPDWPRSTRDQCAASAVPFFFKQWGEWRPDDVRGVTHDRMGWIASDGRKCDWGGDEAKRKPGDPENNPEGWRAIARVGKARAGRHLDGRERNDLPWSLK